MAVGILSVQGVRTPRTLRGRGARWRPTAGMPNLETAEEIEDGGVNFLGALLLGPVTTAGEDEGLAKLRHQARQIGDELVHAAEGENKVPVAGDVERGDTDLRSGERGQEFPATVDVAIPVETPAEACAPKFVYVEV